MTMYTKSDCRLAQDPFECFAAMYVDLAESAADGKSFRRRPIILEGATLANACLSSSLELVSRRTITMVPSAIQDMTSESAMGSSGAESINSQSNVLLRWDSTLD